MSRINRLDLIPRESIAKMGYKLVNMMATKKELQKPEVNSEYLKFNHLNPNKFSNIIRK